MAIIQISKIQARAGNLVDLPQLDEAEFGWASDVKKLYIGKTTPNENIEILTSYSNIYYSQINGSYGNLNVTNPVTGQILAYDKSSNVWINSGGNALDPGNSSYYSNNPIHLGNISNVYIGGGAVGYVLETDGLGNLSWSPKGVVIANISNASKTNPVVITTSSVNQFRSAVPVTITDVVGMIQLNGNSYFVKLLTSSTFELYSDSALTIPVDGTSYGTYISGGRAISSVGGGGVTGAGGSPYSVQYNSGGVNTGDANLQWNYISQSLSLIGTASISGNISGANLNTSGQIVSTLSTGTAPLMITSTTRVANLDVAKAGIANTVNDAAQPNITSVGTLANLSVNGNANIGNIGTVGLITAIGNIQGGNLRTTGTITVTGNANVGNLSVVSNVNVGNLTSSGIISAIGNITAPYFIGNVQGNISGNISIPGSNTQVVFNDSGVSNASPGFVFNKVTNAVSILGTLSVNGNANVGNIGATNIVGTLSTNSQPNVTSVGILTTLSASGNANVGNIGTTGVYATTLSVSGNANVGNIGGNNAVFTTFTGNGSGISYIVGSNVTGAVATATTAGTVTTAAQPNITSIGTLTSLSVSGNISGSNITGNHYGAATGLTAIPGANVTGTVASATNLSGGTVNATTGSFSGLITGATGVSTDVNTANDTGSLSVRGNTSTVASMSFHRTGAYAINMGLGTDNIFRIGGWSASNNCLQLSGTGALTVLSTTQTTSLGVGTAASGTTGEIRATNNITAYYSDDRLKTRLGDIQDALDKVKTLDSFYYEANEIAQNLGYVPVRDVGISAQQVQAIMPEVVAPAPIDDTYLTVRYERLVPLLIAAIKELEVRLDAIEKKGQV